MTYCIVSKTLGLNSREGSVYLIVAERSAVIYTIKMHHEKIPTETELLIIWHMLCFRLDISQRPGCEIQAEDQNDWIARHMIRTVLQYNSADRVPNRHRHHFRSILRNHLNLTTNVFKLGFRMYEGHSAL